jgi:cytidine deaminase
VKKRSNPARLLKTAAAASRKAHAPYSRYQVGAALLAADGTVFTGCNVENASYGLTNCAERTALFSAVAAGHTKFKAIAVVVSGKKIFPPCGACRQVLAEFGRPDLAVFIARRDDLAHYETSSLGELLPKTFRL